MNNLVKNCLWGILLFLLNIFILFLNYSKNFTFHATFLIEINQMMAFLVGILYAQQFRKFDFKHIFGIAMNALTFSLLITLLFAVYEAPATIGFTILLWIGTFFCIFISYALYYWLFCPDKYKKKIKNKRKKKAKA